MADRVVTPTGQRHFIEPFDQRVFQFDTPNSDVFLSRVANSVYQVLGDDIVMYGLDVGNLAFTSDSVTANVLPGAAIQDQTLIINSDPVSLEMTGVSGMDQNGKVVVISNYNYLETFEQNQNSVLMNYIDSTGNPLHSFSSQRDRIILAILEFTKDASDNVTGVTMSQQTSITINGNEYYVKGFSPNNKRLTAYLTHQMITNAQSSIELDSSLGLRLLGDLLNPGNLKFYGTNQAGVKGWYDLSTLSVDNESTLEDYQKQFNMIFTNGNLIFLEDGHDLNRELYPSWNTYTTDTYWTGEIDFLFDSSLVTWNVTGPNPQLKVADGEKWNLNYRPIKFRIHHTLLPVDTTIGVTLYDRNGNIIAQSDDYSLDQELYINWENNEDIYRITFTGATTIRGIEFFGGTPGDITL